MSADPHDIHQPVENFTEEFWQFMDQLVTKSEIIIDRPRGSAHPNFPELIYPFDYGYLAETKTVDGSGIDIWVGSLADRCLDAAALTVDLEKRDAEIKLLIGCTAEEKQTILEFSNGFSMRACMIQRGGEIEWLRTRRSVRHFQSREIPEDLLDRVLETAIWAPSAHNRQPWRFAVLRSLESRQKLADTMGVHFRNDLLADGLSLAEIETQVNRSRARILNAPVAVVLCLDTSQGDIYPDPIRQQAENLMGVQSVALAGGFLLLAAHAAGLAGVWICAPLFAAEAVRQALHLHADWLPQALILLGFPEGQPRPRSRKPVSEVTVFL